MTATTAPAMTDPPPRRRLRGWARRHIFTTFVVSAVALALVLRLGWGWYFARRLAVALEDLRRRGEPMELADFAESPLPPSENAWTYYAEAVRVISTSGVNSPHQSTIRYSPYPPHGTEWETLARASEKANAAAFPLARRARQLQRLQFPQTGSNPYRGEWNDARNLANMLADGAE